MSLMHCEILIGNGKKTDSTQEMIAVGAGSIFCSFFGCIPLTASFSRSSVLSASGGKTQFASLFNGIAIFFLNIGCDYITLKWFNSILGCVILFALAFLMPTFFFIPKSILGAVLITAVYPMIEYHEVPSMWRGRRKTFNSSNISQSLIFWIFLFWLKGLSCFHFSQPLYAVCWLTWNMVSSSALKCTCSCLPMKAVAPNPP